MSSPPFLYRHIIKRLDCFVLDSIREDQFEFYILRVRTFWFFQSLAPFSSFFWFYSLQVYCFGSHSSHFQKHQAALFNNKTTDPKPQTDQINGEKSQWSIQQLKVLTFPSGDGADQSRTTKESEYWSHQADK